MPYSQEIERLRALPLAELMAAALETKLKHRGVKFSLCSIMNAKSGKCGEDCRFCVQSAHYRTEVPVYPLKGTDEVIAAAREAKRIGATHFSLVTSGRGLPAKEVRQVAGVIRVLREHVDISVCASLGILDKESLMELQEAGMSRYHHNLEASKEFFPEVVTTHTFEDRLKTIADARAAGLEVCAGGIFGLGETEEDRLSMALSLRECGVVSVPVNILIPLPGTPLEQAPPLSAAEIVRSIALYRLLLPDVPIRFCAGRETALSDFLSSAFLAGADGMMIGGYLTQRGRSPEADNRFVAEMVELWSM